MEFTIRVLGWALLSFEYEPTRSEQDDDDGDRKPFEAGSGGQHEVGYGFAQRPRWSPTEPYGPDGGEV